MALVNENFLRLPQSYLFSDIAKRVSAFRATRPDADIIRLGIGDVTRPLAPAVVEAIHRAADEMSRAGTFRGYGPEHGYDFLREAIIRNDYLPRGVRLDPSEIFVNDGAKSDTGNIGDILGLDNTLCMTDPIYPVYVDSNAMCGRAGTLTGQGWSNIVYCPADEGNGFTPPLPDQRVDIIYLCYPNNPTGAAVTGAELKRWVDYALANDAIIMYDAAYEAYIREEHIPHSIYEIRGARRCAIEFRSYSKTAGFTGVRCGYTVVPRELTAATTEGRRVELNTLWNRRQCTKFNGTSYIQQRAAQATYSPEGKEQTRATIDYYMGNAALMRSALSAAGLRAYGGVNAPYIWLRVPGGKTSWQFFDELLRGPHIVGTPGSGFGPSGEGYFRLTAFGDRADCERAMERMAKWL